jgi:hypothetical protein
MNNSVAAYLSSGSILLVVICGTMTHVSLGFAETHGDPPYKGLASKYLGDQGIEKDPNVVFAEDFERGSLHDLSSRWENIQNLEIMSFSQDVPAGSPGSRSLLMTHIGGQGTGGHLYRRLLPGYGQLYIRFYVKFDPDCYPIHHFVHVGGYNPATGWPQGGAGIRPAGHERFTTGVEPYGQDWRWDFYSYWMGMRSSPDGKFWGHDFINDKELKAERGKWVCVELMMRMNEPATESNGEQALWIDGKPWAKIRREVGLPDLKFHDLRKTFASLLGQRGVSTAVTQRLLEHSSPQLTNDVYTNVDPVLRQAVDLLPVADWV